MYRDKHLQREANKKASQRRRDKAKGMTQGMTDVEIMQGMTESKSGTSVIPKSESHVDASDVGAVKTLHQAINKPKRSYIGAVPETPDTTSPNTDTLRTEAESLQHKSGTDTMSVKQGKEIKCITIGDQAKSMKTMAMLHSGKPKPQSHSPMMVGYVPPKN